MATQVILLEKVESLGNLGDLVSVKPGFARNYLLPQKKAMRATKQNIAFFEAQKKHIQAESEKLKKVAEKNAKALSGIKVPLIRQASQAGQLYGSVTSRDIANSVSETSGEKIAREMVLLNQNFKMIGLFPVELMLHPEVKVSVTINIARTTEEAQIQAETGRALVAGGDDHQQVEEEVAPAQVEEMLEESALEAVKAEEETEA